MAEIPHLTRTIFTDSQMAAIFRELANAVASAHPDPEKLLIVGIQRRGADIAKRLQRALGLGNSPASSLDINLYRDDWTRLAGGAPRIGKSFMPCTPDGKIVLLVDDVLFSGRTARAAMEAILDYGRPDKIELLAFIDRGHRELPICANYVGRKLETSREEQVDVLLNEHDGNDAVIVRSPDSGQGR